MTHTAPFARSLAARDDDDFATRHRLPTVRQHARERAPGFAGMLQSPRARLFLLSGTLSMMPQTREAAAGFARCTTFTLSFFLGSARSRRTPARYI